VAGTGLRSNYDYQDGSIWESSNHPNREQGKRSRWLKTIYFKKKKKSLIVENKGEIWAMIKVVLIDSSSQ